MATEERQGNLDPADISVDEQGRLVIDNPILSAAIRNQISQGPRAAARVAGREASSFNLIACGNHCAAA